MNIIVIINTIISIIELNCVTVARIQHLECMPVTHPWNSIPFSPPPMRELNCVTVVRIQHLES